MIFGSINSEDTYLPLLWNNIFEHALEKIKLLTTESPLGTESIDGDKFFINVHTYNTKFQSECFFEGHRNTIDIQYVIDGGEYIDWALKEDLTENGKYNADKDFQFYESPSTKFLSRIHLSRGHLAVFFPNDAHRPQISDNVHKNVLKAVVKINTDLLQ